MAEKSESSLKTRAFREAVRHYARQLTYDKRFTIPALILPGMGNILAFYAPTLVIAALLDRFTDGTQLTFDDVLPYVLTLGGIFLGGELLWRLAIHLEIKQCLRSMERLYDKAIEELMRKDLDFFHNNFVGSLTKKALAYGKNFELFIDTLTFSVLSQLIPLVFVVFILGRYSPWLVVALFALIAVTVSLLVPLVRRRQALVDDREIASNVMAGHVSDIIGNMDAVQAFGREQQERRTHERYVHDYVRKAGRSWHYQNQRVDMMTMPLYVLTNLTGLCLALALSRNGALDFQAVFVTFNYYAAATRIVWEFSRIYRHLESSLTEAAQFTELLQQPPRVTDQARPVRFTATRGRVALRNVSFRYQDDDADSLFENLNLAIEPGQKVALVGHSGGGKSTITKLLLRFMDVQSGAVLIDGQNIAHARQVTRRRSIAYVPQEPVMFHRSLLENIRYGKSDAPDETVFQAARQANADEFIHDLPEGYATLVGERGVKLSGGQRQRIAIARAIIKDAPILLLDEATSALDSESESLVQEALWKLMENRTTLVIAHRLSTIQKMDRIIVLDKGRIIEDGTHSDLLATKGTYARLWAHQSGGFIED